MDLLPDALSPVDLLRLVEEVEVAARSVHMDPIRTARVVMASYVHIAEAGDALVVQPIHDLGSIETHNLIVMPCMAMGVHEEGRVGEIIVVIDDVAEVHLAQLLELYMSLDQLHRVPWPHDPYF